MGRKMEPANRSEKDLSAAKQAIADEFDIDRDLLK
jgi:hypothetical protein